MTITIIVPVYGVEKYIRECAVSLFSQTYKEIEYIFCDDCTPDRSMDILHEVMAEYPERKVRIIRNETNKGLGGTRAHLTKEVKTDYFLIVDSDDILPRNAVEILAKRMKETGTDFVEGGYAEYCNGNICNEKAPSHLTGNKYKRKAWCQNLMEPHVWGRLYKTEILQKVPDLFMEGIDYAEDLCAMMRLIGVATRSWTDETVYLYRTDNNASYTKNISEKSLLSYAKAQAKILSFYLMRGHLPLAIEIGALSTLRECRRNGMDMQKMDDILQYVPEHFRAKLLYALFHSTRIPLIISDYTYRVFRLAAL